MVIAPGLSKFDPASRHHMLVAGTGDQKHSPYHTIPGAKSNAGKGKWIKFSASASMRRNAVFCGRICVMSRSGATYQTR